MNGKCNVDKIGVPEPPATCLRSSAAVGSAGAGVICGSSAAKATDREKEWRTANRAAKRAETIFMTVVVKG